MSGIATAVVAGSYLTSQGAKSAGQTAAEGSVEAARIAAEAAKFRPVGITSRFGSSNFQYDDQGNLIGAGYTPSTQITGYQTGLDALTNQYLAQAGRTQPVTGQLETAGTRMFGLGAQALPTEYNPTAAAQQYMQQQQMLLAPGREREMANVQNQMFQAGRSGLAVGGTKAGYGIGDQGLAQSSPEMAALYNARAAQDAQLAATAQQTARANLLQDIQAGQGLTQAGLGMFSAVPQYQTAMLAPFQTTFGTQQQLEQAAMQPLDISAQLAGRSAQAGAAQGQALLQGGLTAAQQGLQGNLAGAGILANVGSGVMSNLARQTSTGGTGWSPSSWFSSPSTYSLSTPTSSGYAGGGNYLNSGVTYSPWGIS